jgi:hypothetical protein
MFYLLMGIFHFTGILSLTRILPLIYLGIVFFRIEPRLPQLRRMGR